MGSWLLPMLVEAGLAVTVVSRGIRQPSPWHDAWREVPGHLLDRSAALLENVFGDEIAALAPDIVIDLLPPRIDASRQLVAAMEGGGVRLVQLGSIAAHGPCGDVAVCEGENLNPISAAGQAALEVRRYLLETQQRVRACVVEAGFLVGPGGCALNPAGNFSSAVFTSLAADSLVRLPGTGETRLQLVHVEDVAQFIMRCLARPERSLGEAYHAVAPPVTQRQYAESLAGPERQVHFEDIDTWALHAPDSDVALTRDVLRLNANFSGEKARAQLGFTPRHPVLMGTEKPA